MSKAPNTKRRYDLKERTAKFGEAIINFYHKLPKNTITIPLIAQLVKSATSVGINYCEADDAVSSRDFKNKIGYCKKESRKLKHFLRMIAAALTKFKEEIKIHWQEAKELHLIFVAILRKAKA